MKPKPPSEIDLYSNSSSSKWSTRLQKTTKIGSVLISGIGFLADAYDLFVIDFVVAILTATAYKEPTAGDKSLIVSSTLAGAVVGQLFFGIAADYVGRKAMFVCTAFLVICGSITSAFVGWGYQTAHQSFGIFHQLAICRFFLGCGIGGEYPLSATISSETSEEPEHGTRLNTSKGCLWYLTHKPNSIAAVFSMQGVGMLLSPLIVMLCIKMNVSLETTWRFCLGIGAVPSAIAFVFRWRMSETTAFKESQEKSLADSMVTSMTANYQYCPHSHLSKSEMHYEIKDLSGEDPSIIHVHNTKESECTTSPASYECKSDVCMESCSTDKYVSNLKFSSDVPNLTAAVVEHDKVKDGANRKNAYLYGSKNIATGRPGKPGIGLASFGAHVRRSFMILKQLRYVLLGTSLTWFIIDVTLYGTGSFKSVIVATWFLSTPEAAPKARALSDMEIITSAITTPFQENRFSEFSDTDFELSGVNVEGLAHEDVLDLTPFSMETSRRTADSGADIRDYSFGSFSSPRLSAWTQKARRLLRSSEKTARIMRLLETSSNDVDSRLPLQRKSEQKARDDVFLQATMGAVVALLAIPGYILSVLFIHVIGAKRLQSWGFLAVCIVFITLGLEQLCLPEGFPVVELILFGLTFLCSNFGPNTTTFIIPTQVFPTPVRATCHGFSAAMGKLGGVFGTSLFSILEREIGLAALLILCGVVAFFGVLFTRFIPKDLYAEKKLIGRKLEQLNDMKCTIIATTHESV